LSQIESLIVRLARDVEPVRVLPSPATRLLRWLGVAAGVVGAAVVWFRPRADLASLVGPTSFTIEALFVAGTAIAAAAAVLVSSVPGLPHARTLRAAAWAAFAAWFLATMVRLAGAGSPVPLLTSEPPHPACLIRVVAVGAVPVLVLGALVRRAAPFAVVSSGALATLAGFAAAATAVHVVCPINSAAHSVLWHITPVAALAVFGAMAARPALGRNII
jgi:hypothetical protein